MINFNALSPGVESVIQKKIQQADTWACYGRDTSVNLLASPCYADLMIMAAMKTVEAKLPEGYITIGSGMEFTHEALTGAGMTVTVKATLTAVDGERLTFEMIAFDELGEIGRGKHERVIVDEDLHARKAKQRMKDIECQYMK